MGCQGIGKTPEQDHTGSTRFSNRIVQTGNGFAEVFTVEQISQLFFEQVGVCRVVR